MTNHHADELLRAEEARRRAEAALREAKRMRPAVNRAVAIAERFRTENHVVEMILDAFGRDRP